MCHCMVGSWGVRKEGRVHSDVQTLLCKYMGITLCAGTICEITEFRLRRCLKK